MWVARRTHVATWPKQPLVPSCRATAPHLDQQLKLDFAALRKLAVPGAAMLALEAWAFEVSSLLAGLLRDLDSLGAHILLLNVCGFVFLRS
jgi:hypothetical protein